MVASMSSVVMALLGVVMGVEAEGALGICRTMMESTTVTVWRPTQW